MWPTGPDGCPLLGSGPPPAGRGLECAIFAGASEQFHAGANNTYTTSLKHAEQRRRSLILCPLSDLIRRCRSWTPTAIGLAERSRDSIGDITALPTMRATLLRLSVGRGALSGFASRVA